MNKVLASIRFGSPWPRELRDFHQAVDRWFFGGRHGRAPQEPADPLEPFREAWGSPPKKLISIRVDEHLLALVREMGRQAEMPYQEILRIWMEEGMRRALREGEPE